MSPDQSQAYFGADGEIAFECLVLVMFLNIILYQNITELGMKSKVARKRTEHALMVEWGGLTAEAYGRPAVFALLLIVFGLIALKFA